MAAISMDLRTRIFDARQAGESTAEAAERFAVSPAFVRRLLQRHRETGTLAPKTGPRGPTPKLAGAYDRIRHYHTEHPDHSPAEVVVALHLRVSVATAGRAFAALGLTFKKKTLHASERDRPDVKAARATWFARVAAAAPARLIFLDETWFTTAMGRMYGYAPRGHRLHDAVPLRRWTRLTFVAGLTADGLIAPRVFDGSMTGDRFADYLRRALIPACRPGDVLILDNLSAHKTTAVRQVLRAGGVAVRYLPAYSPDRNPIEQAFSKLKRLVRTAAERTVDGLKKLTRTLARKLRPPECRNYIRHSGYPATIT